MSTLIQRRRNRRRAGASARQQYRQHLRQWRRRNRILFATIWALALILYCALIYLSRDHLAFFFLGMLAGVAVAVAVAAFNSPPQWIENYLRGAWGEERTSAELVSLLDEGWVIIHDLARLTHNLDHVLVGPPGVFVIETKNFGGTVAVRRDMVTIQYADHGKPLPMGDKIARQARSQGVEVNRMLTQRGHLKVWVTAAVAIWGDFPQGQAEGDRVTFVAGDQLVEWLRGQRARLSAQQIDQIAELLRPGQRRRPPR